MCAFPEKAFQEGIQHLSITPVFGTLCLGSLKHVSPVRCKAQD